MAGAGRQNENVAARDGEAKTARAAEYDFEPAVAGEEVGAIARGARLRDVVVDEDRQMRVRDRAGIVEAEGLELRHRHHVT